MNPNLTRTLLGIARSYEGGITGALKGALDAHKDSLIPRLSQTIPSKGWISSSPGSWYEGEPLHDLFTGRSAVNTVRVGSAYARPEIRLPGALNRFQEVPRYNKDAPFSNTYDPYMDRYDLVSSQTPPSWGANSGTGFGISKELDNARSIMSLPSAHTPLSVLRSLYEPYTASSKIRSARFPYWSNEVSFSPQIGRSFSSGTVEPSYTITRDYALRHFGPEWVAKNPHMLQRNKDPRRMIPGPYDARPWDPSLKPEHTSPPYRTYSDIPFNGGY